MAATVPTDARVPAAGDARPARSILVEGVVQGVGFRPFVWRLATELGLAGRVRNAAGRVEIEAAGAPASLDAFARRLRSDAPPRARVERVTVTDLDPQRGAGLPLPFAIDDSVSAAATDRLFPPDIATCDDCLRELADPADRRYRYPFTNCTNCGPRATIIDELPYDRAQTTMRAFPLCAACERGVSRPGRPPVPRGAGRLSGLRAAAVVAAHRGADGGRDGRGRPEPRPFARSRTARSWRSRAWAATTSPATPPTRRR